MRIYKEDVQPLYVKILISFHSKMSGKNVYKIPNFH